MQSIDIYFYDLTTEAQQKVLGAAGMKDPAEGNWDVLPLTSLEFETEDNG